MSKADRKRARDKRREEAKSAAVLAGVPELAPSKTRQPNGQRHRTSDRTGDPRKTALEARVRQFGGKDTRAGRNALSGQHMSTQLGMVLQHQCRDHNEAARLWSVFAGWCAAVKTYQARILSTSDAPKGATIAMVSEAMQLGHGDTADLRDPEQKDRDAKAKMDRWTGLFHRLSQADRTALQLARRDSEDAPLWKGRAPTARGLRAYRALCRLRDLAEV